MASSSSASSVISFESESSREPTPEYDPTAAYEVRAPLHWDAKEWDFHSQSEDDESLTDGEDLALLFGAELEEDDEDDASWGEDFSTSEERVDSFSSKEDPTAGDFLFGRSSDETSDDTEEAEDNDGFTSNSSGNDDSGNNSSDDSGASIAPPTKRRKTTGVYWW
ncbi:hypothetical protein PAHAL_8G109700 [Panicum hallii]|jgi:hypothetical protein|uniref:Uncharacterized protein n=1 Tax=Panicum hallii TaxID=206008 RepID=A0A2S3IDR4_9POAL|nr:hypothetical protein PAHAL_8G109700 [Panicum hallii]